MRVAGRNLSPPKLNAQRRKIWDVRPGVRKIKASVELLWMSAKKAKTMSKSYVHEILKWFGRYPEEEEVKVKPGEFQRPPEPGKCFCIDTGACSIGDKTQIQFQPIYDEFNSELVVLVAGMSCDHRLSLKALEEITTQHYNECRSHPSFDNKTPAAVRIAATGNNLECSPPGELEKWDAFYRSIPGRTKPATC